MVPRRQMGNSLRMTDEKESIALLPVCSSSQRAVMFLLRLEVQIYYPIVCHPADKAAGSLRQSFLEFEKELKCNFFSSEGFLCERSKKISNTWEK